LRLIATPFKVVGRTVHAIKNRKCKPIIRAIQHRRAGGRLFCPIRCRCRGC
jgi:hypothetical protein